MKVFNLKKGQIFKNLKELCQFLQIEYKDSTNSRKKIIKELEQYIKFHKNGRKIVIDDIYNIPKEKTDNRGKSEGSRNNNDGIYGKYIDPILIYYFQKCIKNGKHTIYESNTFLATESGIINNNYKTAYNNKLKFIKCISQKEGLLTFTSMNNVFTKLQDIKKTPIISSLDRLKEKGLISYTLGDIISYNYISRLPNKEEQEIIINCKKMAKEEIEYIKLEKKINRDDELKIYYNSLDKLIKQEIEKVDMCWTGYQITINDNILNKTIDNIKESKQKLNKIIIEKVKNKMIKNKQGIEKKYIPQFGIVNPNLPKWILNILDAEFLMNCDIFIKYLVSLDTKDIRMEIENIELNKK